MSTHGEVAQLAANVEALVKEVEAGTSAEIIVVVVGKSAGYGEVIAWAALAAALGATAFFCWSPWLYNDAWIPVNVALTAGLVAAVLWTSGRLRARLARGGVREVNRAADAAFWEEAVHATHGRTGVLVYVSVLERIVAIRADSAIAANVPADAWIPVVRAFSEGGIDNERFAGAFRAMGAVLAKHLPRAADDVNESPDAPRIRE